MSEPVWSYRTGLSAEQEIRVEALAAAAKVVDSTAELSHDVGAAVLALAERFAGWIGDGKP